MRTSASFFIVFTPLLAGFLFLYQLKLCFLKKVSVGMKIRIGWLVGFLKIEYRIPHIINYVWDKNKNKSKVIQLLEF